MVDINTQNMQVNQDLLIAQQKPTKQQEALAQAQAGLAANQSLPAPARDAISSVLGYYSFSGVDISKYSDLSYECLSRISQNEHETIMTMLEDWAVFLQQQAKLDKEAAAKATETAREVQKYLQSQGNVRITNKHGKLIKDRRVIARMSPEQQKALKLANLCQNIVTTLSTPATATVATPRRSVISDGSIRPSIAGATMNANRICLEPPHNDSHIGVSTSDSGTKVID